MPVLHWQSIYEWGVHLALWVSAIEILAHADRDKVSLEAVWDLLEQYQWRCPDLEERSYSVNRKQGKRHLSLPQFLYWALYKARNDFLHGNSVTEDRLKISMPDGRVVGLISIAPVIYRTALAALLGLKPPVAETLTPDVLGWYSTQREYAECLLQSDERHRGDVPY